jgi:hypothetical protein
LTRLASLALLLAACAPCEGDYTVGGACIVEGSLTPDQAEAARAQLPTLLPLASKWWGGDIHSLDGWTVTFRDSLTCLAPDSGCTSWREQTIDVVVSGPSPCVLDLAPALAHEVGHAVLGPPSGRHEDPRWQQGDAMVADLRSLSCPDP